MRILFTGGSGKAGRHCIDYLHHYGHKILNVDKVDLAHPDVPTRLADISDAGQMYDIMSSYAHYDELEAGTGVPTFDAVVHFAAVPRMLFTSDNECFRINTVGTYNVIDAAIKMGIKKVIFASSETAYGICFADGERKPDYLPIDEEHSTVPEDSYAMSKVVNEVTAKASSAEAASTFTGFGLTTLSNRMNTKLYSQPTSPTPACVGAIFFLHRRTRPWANRSKMPRR